MDQMAESIGDFVLYLRSERKAPGTAQTYCQGVRKLHRYMVSHGFGELVDQGGGGGVADPAALLAGGQAQAYEQVGLAGAGVTEGDDRLAGVNLHPTARAASWAAMPGMTSALKSAGRLRRGNLAPS